MGIVTPRSLGVRALAALGSVAMAPAVSAQAQEAEWKRLEQEVETHYEAGNLARAEAASRQAVAFAEARFGPDHPNLAASLNTLGLLLSEQAKAAEAEPVYRRALAIRERALGPGHPDVAVSLNNLAQLFSGMGQYAQAEPLLLRALAIREKVFGPAHADVAQSLNNLGLLYKQQGRYEQAEPLYKRSLAVLEQALGPEHEDVATSLGNLATLLDRRGQHGEAEPLFLRALAILEKKFGPDHLDVALTLNNLAENYRAQGRAPAAEPLFRRSLSIFEKALGGEHPNVAHLLNNLALMLSAQRKYAEAEPLLRRSLAILEKALGPERPAVALSLNNLATAIDQQGRYAEAEPLYLRSLAIQEKALGPEHPEAANSLYNLANLNNSQGRYAQALAYARRGSALYRRRIVEGGASDSATRESLANRKGFFLHLSLLARNPDKQADAEILDEGLQLAQLLQTSSTAAAVAKMAARFARGDDALAALARRRQDLVEQGAKLEAQLVRAAGRPPGQRDAAAERAWREDLARSAKELGQVDDDLARRFPDYQELTRPLPLSAEQVRRLLKPREAMLVYALGKQSYLWVISGGGARFVPLQVDAVEVSARVARLRGQLGVDALGRPAPVDVELLHGLYKNLFAPALPFLAGIRHVMLVPAGALGSLPPGMLVASPPKATARAADYRRVDWLARRYDFAVLPSVGSIRAFRQFSRGARGQAPFAGIGDPLIGEPSTPRRDAPAPRGLAATPDMASLFRGSPAGAEAGPAASPSEGTIADVDAIRSAPRLPETADELRAMARTFGADPHSLWLQGRATESRIKQLDLARYRVLAFATHGVLAGEVKGIGEPGLILTPPERGTLDDDGYLASSEIARLKFNADLVVLSACNTAAADGTPGAEGLSGLAKAFFYAGARSLLVSHWPVVSSATVPLTTTMLREYRARPGQGKSAAHRKAMLALMSDPRHPEYAHPLFWAPFVVVGEGGAGGP